MAKDTQVVEILGKNFLVNQLLRAGIEVAEPVRDNGIDLLIYLSKETLMQGYPARPVQIKAASQMLFSIDKKYEKYPHLILAYIWNLDVPGKQVVYGMDYQDALGVAGKMGYTSTDSWRKGCYVTTRPGAKLLGLLKPFEMSGKLWKDALQKF